MTSKMHIKDPNEHRSFHLKHLFNTIFIVEKLEHNFILITRCLQLQLLWNKVGINLGDHDKGMWEKKKKKENHLRSGLLPYTTITLYQIKRPESVSSLQSVSTSCQNLTSNLLKVIVIVWHLFQVMVLA